MQAVTRVNAEQASKRVMQAKSLRHDSDMWITFQIRGANATALLTRLAESGLRVNLYSGRKLDGLVRLTHHFDFLT